MLLVRIIILACHQQRALPQSQSPIPPLEKHPTALHSKAFQQEMTDDLVGSLTSICASSLTAGNSKTVYVRNNVSA